MRNLARATRTAFLAFLLAPAAASSAGIDAAMQCVYGTMTGAFVPATASVEQLASVALARCADEIEMAAIAMAGAPLAHARVEASRTAVRQELHGYALTVAAGPATEPSEATRTSSW